MTLPKMSVPHAPLRLHRCCCPLAWGRGLLLAVTVVAGGCSQALLGSVPTEPLRQITPSARLDVEVTTLLVGEELPARGVTEDAALGVALRVHNGGHEPHVFSVSSLWLLLAVDERHPEHTLSWSPIGGGAGPLPSKLGENSDLVLGTATIAPGETKDVWALFGGYRFAESHVPRRITLVMPDAEGNPMEVTLADPRRGELRWTIPAPRSQTMAAIQGQSLLGSFTKVQFTGSALARVARAGRFLWDGEFRSGVAIQSEGKLQSSTSSFSVSALAFHLTAPVLTWGPWQDPRRLGVFGGGGGALWTSLVTPTEARAGVLPHVYGALFIDVGLELDFGTWLPLATPFPLSHDPQPGLPRWSIRLGYTQSWLDGGTSAGIVNGVRFSF